MVEVWESWLLAGLGVFQLAVAWWWWQGPYLRGTRGWVTGLFALNGLATLTRAVPNVPDGSLLDITSGVFDRWTLLFLLGFGLVGLRRGKKASSAEKGIVTIAALALVALTVRTIQVELPGSVKPPWISLLANGILMVAIIVGGIALIRWTRSADQPSAAVWILLLAGLGMRYAELATWLTPPTSISAYTSPDLLTAAENLLSAAALLSMLAAAVALLYRRSQPEKVEDLRLFDLSLILVLAGFLFGFARVTSANEITLAIVFSLAVVRPLVFLGGQYRLDQASTRTSQRLSWLKNGAGFFGSAFLGALLAPGLRIPGLGAWAVGAMFGLFGWVIATNQSLPFESAEAGTERKEPVTARNQAPRSRDWGIEEERVQLPSDWRDRVTADYEAYRELPLAVQAEIASLSRWQRILLVLEGAPEGDGLPAYERTTPGLHLLTQCPYASIGPEVSRANNRAERILEEVGLGPPPSSMLGEEPLIESRFGSAEGLDSPRAKSYQLTGLGEQVAERLREAIGLGDLDPEDAHRLAGEAFEPREPA